MILSSRSTHKQLAINMASSIAVFALNLCVSFFLTPFIVAKLGTAAYGFVGLSNNIIGYTSLLTVALNSMAGRFVTVKVHEGNLKHANIYLSSVFFANLLLAGLIFAILAIVVVFLPDWINIPSELVGDVRLLFSLLAISCCLGLLTGVVSVSTFIRNRLDFSNIRSLVGTVIRVCLLLLMFGLLPPRLWYIGISVLIMEVYTLSTNYWFFRELTPELEIKISHFDFTRLKEIIASGAWNILNKLSEILSRGFDLLLANLFIGALAMGQLSIAQTLPVMILGFVSALAGNYAPEFTRLYAKGDFCSLKNELLRSVRLSSFICCIPLTIVFVFSDIFFSVWLPTEDSVFLYQLSAIGSIALALALPLEPLWSIFTITNKVRQSSINLITFSICQFLIVILLISFVSDQSIKIYILVIARVLANGLRCITFLPVYGAKCLGFPKSLFYPLILKSMVNLCVILVITWSFKCLISPNGWIGLIESILFSIIVAVLVSFNFLLNKSDRRQLLEKINVKIRTL